MVETRPPRPQTTVVLAMSADGKIADAQHSPPEFGSAADYAHLERQVAAADGILFGSATLKAGETAMRVVTPDLIAARLERGQPEQPAQMVCTRSGDLSPTLRFFQQAVPHWLVTTEQGADAWHGKPHFEQIFTYETADHSIDWVKTLQAMLPLGIKKIAVLGGGQIVAALLAVDLIDELYLTVCPLLLGGTATPTPVAGQGWLQAEAPGLELLSVQQVEHELFLHYRRRRNSA
ncbi:RibD family protein [Acaryochloris sp. IP29b_bin.148]|uniref:RibD family protein n=1 Tax=Acaryochloris sp. IP29b_bin.148 TaxID=2969218 RepID=UPI002604F157|nr:RibD family protein [Acaryochloris sp. IP29b_bin.148]